MKTSPHANPRAYYAGASARFRRDLSREDGMTLAEILVGTFIFAILSMLAFTAVINGSSNLNTVRRSTDLNEEARLVLNRMSRELRQASGPAAGTSAIAYPPGVVNPDAQRTCPASPPCFNTEGDVAITFDVDFTDNGIADHERLTYRYDSKNERLLIQTATQTVPLLPANVTAFKISYRSSHYNCDSNNDGKVNWEELDTSTSAPCPATAPPNNTLDLDELRLIDQLIIEMTVGSGGRAQTYRTHVDLRNQG